MWQMIGVLTELERSLIVERMRARVKATQKRGVKFGPKVKLTPDRFAYARKLIQQGTTPTDAVKIIDIARPALYSAKRLDEMKEIVDSEKTNAPIEIPRGFRGSEG